MVWPKPHNQWHWQLVLDKVSKKPDQDKQPINHQCNKQRQRHIILGKVPNQPDWDKPPNNQHKNNHLILVVDNCLFLISVDNRLVLAVDDRLILLPVVVVPTSAYNLLVLVPLDDRLVLLPVVILKPTG